MLDTLAFLRRVYERFNARDIDGVLACVHADVQWANGQDGGYVQGHEGLRRYWTRQMDDDRSPCRAHGLFGRFRR